ncbi:ABC transporter permease [Parafrigoribacterium soli]|uniref:ABC transporter permease n=1 Tax=Parafrigoribacterium soli TaxID=3144663 RepID=UPI0032EC5C8C
MTTRDHRSSILVTALSAAFGAGLIQATSYLTQIVAGNQISKHESVQIALLLVAGVFILIAVYVGSIVTANTFATIIASRTRTIALMRLIGSSASSLRRAVAREGLLVGVVGAAIGAAVGLALTVGGIRIAAAMGSVPALDYGSVNPLIVLPTAIVVLSTWAASWVGSRRVLGVTPIQAIGTAQEATREETLHRPVRNAVAAVLFFGGMLVLGLGAALGLVSMLGFLLAFVGGVVSFSGVVVGAHLVMPLALRMSGRLLGRSAPTKLAAENALRYPERSSRTAIGLVIGVTLITTFAVAAHNYSSMIEQAMATEPGSYQGADQVLSVTLGVFTTLIGFSALIAAFGMINNLSLNVLQRTRELGLLRALGFTGRQVRGMIVAESAQMTIAAVGLGLILGVVYGWAGAQSLLGSIWGSPGLVWPSIPWLLLVILVVGAALLTLAAAQAPARRATTISPVLALAVD